MKRTIIPGIFALLFLGNMLFAQPSEGIQLLQAPPRPGRIIPIPPRPPIPPELVEVRYYEGEAIIHYNDVRIANGNGRPTMGTVRVLVERDVSKNLFRGRYEICYGSGTAGICEATTTSEWIRGRVQDGVWVIEQGGLVARLGPKQGFVRLDEGRRTITMNLRLKQSVSIPELLPPIAIPE